MENEASGAVWDIVRQRLAAARRQSPIRPGSGGRTPPITYQQLFIWSSTVYIPGARPAIDRMCYRLTGPLQVAALERAIAATIERHDALRTTFRPGWWRRVIVEVHPAASFSLPMADLRKGSAEDAQRALDHEAAQPIDLRVSPLLRAKLIRLADDEYLLYLAVHAIVSDEWSLHLLWRDIGLFYAVFSGASDAPVPAAPAIQHGDYALWQREWMAGSAAGAQREFWRARVAALSSIPRLPLGNEVSSSSHCVAVPIALPADLSDRLIGLADAEGCTPFMVLLAGLFLLLRRYGIGREAVVFGFAACRDNSGTAEVFGHFANLMGYHAKFPQRIAFRTWLQVIRQEVLAVARHQDYPFWTLSTPAAAMHHRAQSVSLVYRRSSIYALDLAGLTVEGYQSEWWDIDDGPAFRLDITRTPAGLAGSLSSSRHGVDTEALTGMAGHLIDIFRRATTDPDQDI